MAQSALEAANAALLKIGERTITSLSDTNDRATTLNARLEPAKRAVLRMHPWNFAIKRHKFALNSFIAVTDGSGEAQVQTSASHGLSTGDYVRISDSTVITYNGKWQITVVDADEFTLDDSTYSATATGKWQKAAEFEFQYSHPLPSDWLRTLLVDEDVSRPVYRTEGGRLLSDSATPEMIYIYEVTDYTLMDTLFYEAFISYLAWDVASIRLAGDNLQKREQLLNEFKDKLRLARHVDATEDSFRKFETEDWVASRFSSHSTYIAGPKLP